MRLRRLRCSNDNVHDIREYCSRHDGAIIISGQLTNTGETVALESYFVELISTVGN